MIYFKHCGKIGDVLSSLYFCKQFTQYHCHKKFTLLLYSNNILNNDYRFLQQDAEFLKQILETQPYIAQVKINFYPQLKSEDIFIDLNKFRQNTSGQIRTWFYRLSSYSLPMNFSKQILFSENKQQFNNLILLNNNFRFFNFNLDMNILKDISNIYFVGLPNQHKNFCHKYFQIKYIETCSGKELLTLINSCKMLIYNQSMMSIIAQELKSKRAFLVPDFGRVLYPNGEYFQIKNNNDLIKLKDILNE